MTDALNKRQFITGSFYALGATAIWAGNYIIARGVNKSIPPVSLAFWRWLIAVIFLFPFALKPLIAQKRIVKENIGYLSLIGLLGVSAFNTLLYIASHTTSAINLSLISLTFPIFIVILSWIFYRETITIIKGIGIILVVLGVLLLMTKGKLMALSGITFSTGDIWMLIGALAWSVYSLLLKRKPQEISPVTFQFSICSLGLLFLIPFYIWESASAPPVLFDLRLILSILYIGIISSLFAYFLWNHSVELIGPSKAGMIFYTSPVFIGILAYIFLKEEIGWVHLYSAMLIVPGILIANYEGAFPLARKNSG